MGEPGNSEQFGRDVFPGELSPSEHKENMGSEYDPTFGGTRDAMPWDSPQMPKRESDFVGQIAAPVEISREKIGSAVTASEESVAPNESRIFNEWYTLSEEFTELQNTFESSMTTIETYLARIDELSNWDSSFVQEIRTMLNDFAVDVQSLVSIQQDIDVYKESKDRSQRDILIPKLTQMREVVLKLFTQNFPRIEQSTSELVWTIQQRIQDAEYSGTGAPQALLEKQTTASQLYSELQVIVPKLKNQAEALDATTNTIQVLAAQA